MDETLELPLSSPLGAPKRRISLPMPNAYTLKKDYIDRLGGCIFMYDGYPYVLNVVSHTKFVLSDMVTDVEVKVISPKDPLLDISSIEVGYYNAFQRDGTPTVYYAQRNPERRYRQGIGANNLMFSGFTDGYEGSPYSKNRKGQAVWATSSEDFRDHLLGIYPSLSEALKLLEEREVVAISREVCIRKNPIDIYEIYFCRNLVASFDGGTAKLPDRKTSWIMSRLLKQNGIEV